MIIFFKKDTGEIYAHIDGRVHGKQHLDCSISDGLVDEKNIGRKIIGWEETDELEDYDVEIETLVEAKKGLFKKVKTAETRQRRKMIEHNMDEFETLQRFEDLTPENPMDYKIDLVTNKLIKLDKTL